MNSLITTTSRTLRAPPVKVLSRNFASGTEVGKEDIKNVAPIISSGSYPAPANEALKRGTGGRSSFNGTVCTVFGPGQIGSHVTTRLGRVGSQVIIPYRGDPRHVADLKLAGDLGQILFMPFYLRDDDSIFRAVKHSNVVVNTIGYETHTTSFDLDDVHVEGARRIARICREAGVQRLIHISALNCHPDPQPIITRKGSQFYKSKYYGELAVRQEFPTATIFRPSEIFGHYDRFLNYYAHWFRRSYLTTLLWKKGKGVFKMPVYASDLAAGIINAMFDDNAVGQTYDAVGPRRYELCDVVKLINQCIQKDEFHGFQGVRDMRFAPIFWLRVYGCEQVKKYPVLNWEKIVADHTTDRPTGNPTLEDLGVSLTMLEDKAMVTLDQYKRFGFYDDALGEFPKPDRLKHYPLDLA